MNERIQDLMYKADAIEILPDQQFTDTDYLADMDPRRVEKFAEAIIEECIISIEKTIDINCVFNGEKMGCEYAITDLKKHFGIT